MTSGVGLVMDSSAVGPINSRKVMIAVPMLYLFMTHYLFQLLRIFKGIKEIGPRLNDLGRRLVLFGVACLFSLNFLQSSILASVISWLTLVLMIIAHCFVFLQETGQKYHNISLLVYYILLAVWFTSEIFFFLLNAFFP